MQNIIVRKLIAISLTAMIFTVSLAGCSNAAPSASSAAQSSSSETQNAVSTQKKPLTVSITISKDFLNGLNSLSSKASSKTASSSASSKLATGVISDTKNSDGSETIVMTRVAYDKSMSDLKKGINDSFQKLKSTATSIKNITANSGMNDFKVTVDKEKWDKSLDGLSLLGIYVASGMYQEFSSVKEPKATFHIIDASNSKEISSVTYPDALNSTAAKK